jgi:hypothetical protein
MTISKRDVSVLIFHHMISNFLGMGAICTKFGYKIIENKLNGICMFKRGHKPFESFGFETQMCVN